MVGGCSPPLLFGGGGVWLCPPPRETEARGRGCPPHPPLRPLPRTQAAGGRGGQPPPPHGTLCLSFPMSWGGSHGGGDGGGVPGLLGPPPPDAWVPPGGAMAACKACWEGGADPPLPSPGCFPQCPAASPNHPPVGGGSEGGGAGEFPTMHRAAVSLATRRMGAARPGLSFPQCTAAPSPARGERGGAGGGHGTRHQDVWVPCGGVGGAPGGLGPSSSWGGCSGP